MNFTEKEHYNCDDFLQIIRILRAPGGCPWDAAQTHESIRMNFIEETYEAAEAIDRQDAGMLREELGDVLMQVIFHSVMEEEKGSFTFDDICDAACRKLIYRHPHIFSGADKAPDWDEIKKQEKQQTTAAESISAVPVTLPGAMRAAKMQKRAAAYGLGWQGSTDALADAVDYGSKLAEEPDEDAAKRFLFSAIGAVRLSGFDPELMLTRACEEFSDSIEEAEHTNGSFDKLTEVRKENLWQSIMFPDRENP